MDTDPRMGAFASLKPGSSAGTLTISIRLAVSALVLTAILLTAAASSLLWWRTAEAISRQLASTIDEQLVAAVRKEVLAMVNEARAAHTAIRTLFLQNVLDAREADKREFVFLSQLQSQPTISWVAFGWPDGSFFAAHKLGDGHLEMMEISKTDHPGQRRVDNIWRSPSGQRQHRELVLRRMLFVGVLVWGCNQFAGFIEDEGGSDLPNLELGEEARQPCIFDDDGEHALTLLINVDRSRKSDRWARPDRMVDDSEPLGAFRFHAGLEPVLIGNVKSGWLKAALLEFDVAGGTRKRVKMVARSRGESVSVWLALPMKSR
jgi:hypothetical protein